MGADLVMVVLTRAARLANPRFQERQSTMVLLVRTQKLLNAQCLAVMSSSAVSHARRSMTRPPRGGTLGNS
jgi:hypothetical protein